MTNVAKIGATLLAIQATCQANESLAYKQTLITLKAARRGIIKMPVLHVNQLCSHAHEGTLH